MKRILKIIFAILICASLSVGVCAETLLIAPNPNAKSEIVFNDVDKESDSGKAIYKLVEAGILLGDGNGSFRPNDPITRAELTKIVNSIFNYTEMAETGFTDVSENEWYYTHVLIAKKAGYIVGFGDGTFRGEEKVTREQACTILCRVASLYDLDLKFEIKDEISDWAVPYVQKVLSNALMSLEKDGTFRATQDITRSEFSVTYGKFHRGTASENKDDGNSAGGGGGGSAGGGGGSAGGGGGSAGGGGSTGNEGGSTGNEGGSTGNEGGSTGNEGGSTGNEGGSTGNEGGSTGNEGGSTGNEGGSTGGGNESTEDEEDEVIDYEEENKEMLENLKAVSDDIDEYYGEFARGNQRNLMKTIKECIDKTILAGATELITADYVKDRFETEIALAESYYDAIMADEAQKTSFTESLGKLNTSTISWIAIEFGVIEPNN